VGQIIVRLWRGQGLWCAATFGCLLTATLANCGPDTISDRDEVISRHSHYVVAISGFVRLVKCDGTNIATLNWGTAHMSSTGSALYLIGGNVSDGRRGLVRVEVLGDTSIHVMEPYESLRRVLSASPSTPFAVARDGGEIDFLIRRSTSTGVFEYEVQRFLPKSGVAKRIWSSNDLLDPIVSRLDLSASGDMAIERGASGDVLYVSLPSTEVALEGSDLRHGATLRVDIVEGKVDFLCLGFVSGVSASGDVALLRYVEGKYLRSELEILGRSGVRVAVFEDVCAATPWESGMFIVRARQNSERPWIADEVIGSFVHWDGSLGSLPDVDLPKDVRWFARHGSSVRIVRSSTVR